ncbi:MAG: hypothetical protein HQK54_16355, partial [Oligoflexales bacterium]|nr:hypothetical protein [Oligoflexales bacterium]
MTTTTKKMPSSSPAKRIPSFLFFFFHFSILISSAMPLPWCRAYAFESLSVDISQKYQPLNKYLYIKEDPERKLEISDILKLGDDSFLGTGGKIPNYGVYPGRIWAKFAMTNNQKKDVDLILELDFAYIGDLRLFSKTPEGEYRHTQAGLLFPMSVREVKNRNPVFPIELKAGSTATFYLRAESNGPIAFPLAIYKPSHFYALDHDVQFIFGIYCGIILGVILYNIFFYLSVRDKTCLTYIWLMIFGYGILVPSLYGVTTEYYWPEIPWLAERDGPLAICFTIVVYGILCQNFLG